MRLFLKQQDTEIIFLKSFSFGKLFFLCRFYKIQITDLIVFFYPLLVFKNTIYKQRRTKMKKTICILLACIVLAFAFTGCSETSDPNPAATDAQGADSLSGTVSTNGSTSMEKVIGILSEQFMNDNSDVTVTYDATGSGTGIEAVSNGTCDIGLSSRALKDEEKEKGLSETTLALDGIAVIVNADCPLDDITIDQLKEIFTGTVSSWSAFGGNGEIACIGRENGSGTRDGFESITGTKEKCKLSQELTSTGAVITAVQSNPNAIGYASFASVAGQDGIKVLTVNKVECNAENISNGSYEIQRPFNLITKDGVELSDAAKAFLEYITGHDAISLIEDAGAVPTAK